MTTAEILRAAAARVRQGWIQGAFEDGAKVCAVGAIENCAGRLEPETREAIKAVACALHIINVPTWNDDPDQTQEGVALGLERAADWWEAQQVPAVEWTHRDRELVES